MMRAKSLLDESIKTFKKSGPNAVSLKSSFCLLSYYALRLTQIVTLLVLLLSSRSSNRNASTLPLDTVSALGERSLRLSSQVPSQNILCICNPF
jgi:hypothetical protein